MSIILVQFISIDEGEEMYIMMTVLCYHVHFTVNKEQFTQIHVIHVFSKQLYECVYIYRAAAKRNKVHIVHRMTV